MAQSLTLREHISTPKSFAVAQDANVEIELLDMADATRTAHDSNYQDDFSDTDFKCSGDGTSSEFSYVEESENNSDNDSGEFVSEGFPSTFHPRPSSFQNVPAQLPSGLMSSYSEGYDSASDELAEEPADLKTSLQEIDAERQRHCAAITELEDKHSKDMIALAIEMQELRNVMLGVKEAQVAREKVLLREKEELRSQLQIALEDNVRLSAKNEQLSLQSLDGKTRVGILEHDYAEVLASKNSLSTQVVGQIHQLQEVQDKSTEEIHSLTIARDSASAEAARLRGALEVLETTTAREHADLIDTSNALRKQLNNTMHELDVERMRVKVAVAQSADDINTLTECRDSLQAELDRIRREHKELANSSQATIDALRDEFQTKACKLEAEHAQALSSTDRSSKEIHALLLAKETIQIDCQKLKGTVSGLEAVVHDREQQLINIRRDLETCRKSSSGDISNLQQERSSLKESVAMIKQQLGTAQTDASRSAREMEGKLETLRTENNDLLKTKDSEVEKCRKLMHTKIDVIQAERNELSGQVEAKDSKIHVLRSENAGLSRKLEIICVKQQQQEGKTKSEMQELQSQVAVLKTKLLESQNHREEAQRKLSQMYAEICDLRRQLAEADETNRSRSIQLQAQCDKLTVEVEARDQKIASLRRKILRLKSD